jgi:Fe-S-cluster containining protein
MTIHMADSANLCLECGLCCNGVIFADVKLQPTDNARSLASLGLGLKTTPAVTKFNQPCSMFDGCRCKIYSERPVHCRKFECALLGSVQSGELTFSSSLRHIRKARRLAAEIEALLSTLEDQESTKPLMARARETCRRLASRKVSSETINALSRLTASIHQLALLLSERFYPGPQ